ncbi:MAG: hypothetical protein P1U70_28130, partial [Saprospiraceae bacterium]|nr:hypothetical protein [Saprospiraceae bacterium]
CVFRLALTKNKIIQKSNFFNLQSTKFGRAGYFIRYNESTLFSENSKANGFSSVKSRCFPIIRIIWLTTLVILSIYLVLLDTIPFGIKN